jgi:hypothetical protein
MAKDYSAGYILQGVRELIKSNPDGELWLKAVKKVSAFHLSNSNINSNEPEKDIQSLQFLTTKFQEGYLLSPQYFWKINSYLYSELLKRKQTR